MPNIPFLGEATMTLVKWVSSIVVLLVFLSTEWNGLVSCDLIVQTDKGINTINELMKPAIEWSKGVTDTAKQVTILFKAASMLGKIAPLFSVAGVLVPFILSLVGLEDPTMTLLKNEFYKVNEKLDKISDKLGKVESKITFENQRAAYIGAQSKIVESSRKMKLMFKELEAASCNTSMECQQEKLKIAERYVDKFKGTEDALYTIIQPKSSSVFFREPLMTLIRTEHECNVPMLTDVFGKLYLLAYQAQKVVVVREKLTGSKMSIVESTANWLKVMYKLRDEMYQNVNECFKSMRVEDHDRNLIGKDLTKNSGKAVSKIRHFFEKKYKWLRWVSLSYISYCS